jgi:hypothetical protein
MNVPRPAAFLGKLGALIGLALGLLYSIGGFFLDLSTTGLNAGTAMAFGAILGMPLMFGGAGFLLGLLAAAVAAPFRRTVDT